MEQLYLICAVAGGTFLGLQFLMLLVGIGGGDADVDVGGDVDMDIGDPSGDYSVDSGEGASAAAATHSFQVISTKTLTAFFTFFGLGGRLGGEMEMLTLPRLAVAVGCGECFLRGCCLLVGEAALLHDCLQVGLKNLIGFEIDRLALRERWELG